MVTSAKLFEMALGIQSPWFVSNLELNVESKTLSVTVDFERGSTFEYEDEDGVKGSYKAYDTVWLNWQHLNFFEFRCELHAHVPRVQLSGGRTRRVKTPWEGLSKGFTLYMEAFLLELIKKMPVHDVAKLINTYEMKLWNMLEKYNERARAAVDMSELVNACTDETAVERGHEYVTAVADADTRRVLFVTPGKSSETLKEFADDLRAHGGDPEKVTGFCADMSPAFIKGIRENFPNAKITFDRFHVMQMINKALDAVRRREAKETPLLKGARYALLKNKENLTAKQKDKREALDKDKAFSKLQTARAILLKENFQALYNCSNTPEFEKQLNKWHAWAIRSRIPEFVELAKSIKAHWDGIVAWATGRLSNGFMEGINSLFQSMKAKARGYKKTQTIADIFYLIAGKLDYTKINPYVGKLNMK